MPNNSGAINLSSKATALYSCISFMFTTHSHRQLFYGQSSVSSISRLPFSQFQQLLLYRKWYNRCSPFFFLTIIYRARNEKRAWGKKWPCKIRVKDVSRSKIFYGHFLLALLFRFKPQLNDHNMSTQHCWAQHVARVWPPCCAVLRHVGCCWLKFDHLQTWANNTQHLATGRNRVGKRPTMLRYVAIVWPGPYARHAENGTASTCNLSKSKCCWCLFSVFF